MGALTSLQQSAKENPRAMEHFIAYHSARTMGYHFESSPELRFLSRKVGVLKRALGNTVWVIQGIPTGPKTVFALCAAYMADQLELEDASSSLHVIHGHRVRAFSPAVPLEGLAWFPELLRSQRNFSLGFSRLTDAEAIKGLMAIPTSGHAASHGSDRSWADDMAAEEGSVHLATHLRRERSRALVEAKKSATLKATGRLCCEACGFDFAQVYGELGEGFCEVHHVVPLADLSESVITNLDDLAVLCSNCHRVIHRASPMVSVSQLAQLISQRPQ